MLKKLSIQKKLYGGFGMILIILIILSGLSYYNISKLNESRDMDNKSIEVLLELDEIEASMLNMQAGQRGFVITGQDNFLEPYEQGAKDFESAFQKAQELTADNAAQQNYLNKIGEEKNNWVAIAERTIANRRLVESGDRTLAEVVKEIQTEGGKANMDEIRNLVNQSVQEENALLETRTQETQALSQRTNRIIIIGTILAIALGCIIAVLIIRSIILPLEKVKVAAEKMAEGNLDVDVEVDSKDEVGVLAKAFQRMALQLNDTISNINSASDQVAAGAGQVSAASQMLSQSSTEQASSIEETTATIEEITAQTKENAENANRAREVSLIAQENGALGDQKMEEMLVSMEGINASSTKVSKIIKVIDEIAFQTNILSLNAAVEAARAGQHGKGFAVVAEEVRNLAARSADAAKETTDMIEGSIHEVEAGMKIAEETSEALEKLTKGASEVAQLVGDIAEASKEQDIAITQIGQAIAQISDVVQTNSATAEESAAASEELSSQSDILKEMVGKFQLKGMHANKKEEAYSLAESENIYAIDQGEKRGKVPLPQINVALENEGFGKY